MSNMLYGILIVVGSLACGILFLWLFALLMGFGYQEPKHKRMEADYNTKWASVNHRQLDEIDAAPNPHRQPNYAQAREVSDRLGEIIARHKRENAPSLGEWMSIQEQKTTDEFNQITGGCCSAFLALSLVIGAGVFYVLQ